MSQAFTQSFQQKLAQNQITNTKDDYVVLVNSDTLYGRINAISTRGNSIRQFTFKHNDQKLKLEVSDVLAIGVTATEMGQSNRALFSRKASEEDKVFEQFLPKDDYVVFERILLQGRKDRFEMAQLLNRGFDSKIKVYAHPDEEDQGFTDVSGFVLDDVMDRIYYVSVNGMPVFELKSAQYRKGALSLLYSNCNALKDIKLRWMDFAEHVFTHFRECN